MRGSEKEEKSVSYSIVDINGIANDDNEVDVYIDLRPNTHADSIISIVRTVFVCIILGGGALVFSNDVNTLVLFPIERMIEKVNKIAKNPVASKNEEIKKDDDQFETILIENAIIKIGQLLVLGFGDAGSEIIAKNIAQKGDVNALIAGQKVCAIFGFCDIRNFTDTTEILQEEVSFITVQEYCFKKMIIW